MMTLKEQYDALIAAGMPEHERVRWVYDEIEIGPDHADQYHTVGGDRVVWFNAANGFHYDLDEPCARDLITMHALRWWRHVVTKQVENDEMLVADDTVAIGTTTLDDYFDESIWAADILDAIVKAVTND